MTTQPTATLDVRTLPHAVRHATIFGILQRMAPGTVLGLLNDHDPAPLRRQIAARWPGAYSWRYLAQGPELWQVAISREAAADAAGCEPEADADHACACGE
jgi:uncharacterized protein (DUF2249 family)